MLSTTDYEKGVDLCVTYPVHTSYSVHDDYIPHTTAIATPTLYDVAHMPRLLSSQEWSDSGVHNIL